MLLTEIDRQMAATSVIDDIRPMFEDLTLNIINGI